MKIHEDSLASWCSLAQPRYLALAFVLSVVLNSISTVSLGRTIIDSTIHNHNHSISLRLLHIFQPSAISAPQSAVPSNYFKVRSPHFHFSFLHITLQLHRNFCASTAPQTKKVCTTLPSLWMTVKSAPANRQYGFWYDLPVDKILSANIHC
jgi:hypothetical protein